MLDGFGVSAIMEKSVSDRADKTKPVTVSILPEGYKLQWRGQALRVENHCGFLHSGRPHSQRYQVVVRCQRGSKDGALSEGRRKSWTCSGYQTQNSEGNLTKGYR